MTIKINITECPNDISCSVKRTYKTITTYKLSFQFLSYEGDYVDKEVSFYIDNWEIKEFKRKLLKELERLK